MRLIRKGHMIGFTPQPRVEYPVAATIQSWVEARTARIVDELWTLSFPLLDPASFVRWNLSITWVSQAQWALTAISVLGSPAWLAILLASSIGRAARLSSLLSALIGIAVAVAYTIAAPFCLGLHSSRRFPQLIAMLLACLGFLLVLVCSVIEFAVSGWLSAILSPTNLFFAISSVSSVVGSVATLRRKTTFTAVVGLLISPLLGAFLDVPALVLSIASLAGHGTGNDNGNPCCDDCESTPFRQTTVDSAPIECQDDGERSKLPIPISRKALAAISFRGDRNDKLVHGGPLQFRDLLFATSSVVLCVFACAGIMAAFDLTSVIWTVSAVILALPQVVRSAAVCFWEKN